LYPARSVIVVTTLDSFSSVLLGSFAMTEVMAPTDIVGMSLAVEFVSFVLQRPAADFAKILIGRLVEGEIAGRLELVQEKSGWPTGSLDLRERAAQLHHEPPKQVATVWIPGLSRLFQRRGGGGNPGRADCQRGSAQLVCRRR
jgi:hypothetical protein